MSPTYNEPWPSRQRGIKGPPSISRALGIDESRSKRALLYEVVGTYITDPSFCPVIMKRKGELY